MDALPTRVESSCCGGDLFRVASAPRERYRRIPKWSDYRSGQFPTAIRIVHHKTGQVVLHPLEELLPNGKVIKFYADAEAVLDKLTRRGLPMICVKSMTEVKAVLDERHAEIVQRMRKQLELPAAFTLDACRHGGMTELEEAD